MLGVPSSYKHFHICAEIPNRNVGRNLAALGPTKYTVKDREKCGGKLCREIEQIFTNGIKNLSLYILVFRWLYYLLKMIFKDKICIRPVDIYFFLGLHQERKGWGGGGLGYFTEFH